MKLNFIFWLRRDEGELLATFGRARLIKRVNGRIELVGGCSNDKRSAREWCSLFLHEAVVSFDNENRVVRPLGGPRISLA